MRVYSRSQRHTYRSTQAQVPQPHTAMKLKWSGFGAVDGRGKINGHVASKNRSGAYARTKVTPVNPQTSFQQNARALLTLLSQSWRALGAARIAGWNTAVGGFARTDIFGDLRNPTGKNLYTRLNANLVSIGQAIIASAPSPAGAGAVTAGALIITNGGVKSIAHTDDAAGSHIQVWATPGVSPGKSFVKNEFRLVTTFVGGAASPAVFTTAYDARFGQPAVDTKVYVQLVSINDTTGENSTPSQSETVTV